MLSEITNNKTFEQILGLISAIILANYLHFSTKSDYILAFRQLSGR